MTAFSVRGRSLIVAVLIALATAAAYLPAIRAGFIWDDDDYVTQNETLVDLPGLRRIWFERGAVPQYYPLVHTSFWIERHLWGMNPVAYHALNILLHALAAILLWRGLVRLRVPGSLLAALVFALHPVGVESVAWITERKNVLSAVFYFAAALAWLRSQSSSAEEGRVAARDRPARKKKPEEDRLTTDKASRWYAASLVLFVCAMLSKTVAVSLPAALLMIAWWKKGRVERRDVVSLLPFFVIAVALAVNTVLMERTRVGAVGVDWSFSVAERVLIAGRAIWFYAAKLVWPSDLTFIYPRWRIDAADLTQWLYPIAAVAVVAAAWTVRKRVGPRPVGRDPLFWRDAHTGARFRECLSDALLVRGGSLSVPGERWPDRARRCATVTASTDRATRVCVADCTGCTDMAPGAHLSRSRNSLDGYDPQEPRCLAGAQQSRERLPRTGKPPSCD